MQAFSGNMSITGEEGRGPRVLRVRYEGRRAGSDDAFRLRATSEGDAERPAGASSSARATGIQQHRARPCTSPAAPSIVPAPVRAIS